MKNVIRFRAPKTCHVDPRGALVQYVDYLKLQQELDSIKPKWQSPESIPAVKLGTEKEYWIAVANSKTGKTHVFLAIYQNRPLETDEDGEFLDDDYLVTPDGDPFESIGWVSNKSHYEFDDFYVPIQFDDEYRLLGWAEYTPPEFNGETE